MTKNVKTINVVGIIAKSNVLQHEEILKEIVEYLKKHHKEVVFDNHACKVFPNHEACKKEKILAQSDLVVVLGGDGSILKTARAVSRKKTLVLGVNFGNLGFLSETTPHKIFDTLDKIFAGQYVIDKRTLLRVTIYRNGQKIQSFLALNEAVINQGAFARLIKMDLAIDNRKVVNLKADGLIIATPTGSTAHSLSAGGPIVHPHISSLLITPICPSSLSMRSIVVPDNKQLTVSIETHRREESATIGLTVDGQDMTTLQYGDKIKFRCSSRHIYFARTKHRYYRILRSKLNWGVV